MIRFWVQKFKLMYLFATCGWWDLVRDEWKLTRKELDEARANSEEINQKAAEKLLKAIQKK